MNKPPDLPGRDTGISGSKFMMGIATAAVVVLGYLASRNLERIESSVENQGITSMNHYVEVETRLATIEAILKTRDIEVAEIKNSQTDIENRMGRIEWAGRPPRPKN